MHQWGTVAVVITVLIVFLAVASIVLVRCAYPTVATELFTPEVSWQEEYEEAKGFGASVVYLCSMNLNCARYREEKHVGLCVLASTEGMPASQTTTVGVSRANISSVTAPVRVGDITRVKLKECRKTSGFTRR